MRYYGKIQHAKDLITKEYADNGLAKKADSRSLTKAEYEALTEAEKLLPITYIIIDDEESPDVYSKDEVDTRLNTLKSSLAIIANGNTHLAIGKDQYVYIQDHDTLAEGMYKAKSAIAANATLSTSNVQTANGLNDLKSALDLSIQKAMPVFGIGSHSSQTIANPSDGFYFVVVYRADSASIPFSSWFVGSAALTQITADANVTLEHTANGITITNNRGTTVFAVVIWMH